MANVAAELLDCVTLSAAANTDRVRSLLKEQHRVHAASLVPALLAEDAALGGGRDDLTFVPGHNGTALRERRAAFATAQAEAFAKLAGTPSLGDKEDNDSDDNDAPQLPKPTFHDAAKAAKPKERTPNAFEQREAEAAKGDRAELSPEVKRIASALLQFYSAVGADKTKPSVEATVQKFAGNDDKTRLALSALEHKYAGETAALEELRAALLPGSGASAAADAAEAEAVGDGDGGSSAPASSKPPVVVAASAGGDQFTVIAKFAWSQGKKFVNVHIDWEGCYDLPRNQVEAEFGPTSVQLRIYDKAPSETTVLERHQWKVVNLCHPIDASKSKLVRKTNRLVLKLKKLATGVEWSDLTDTLDKKKKARERRIANGDLKGASTQQLLADMYANATDEERKGLMEAAHKGRSKREGEGEDSV